MLLSTFIKWVKFVALQSHLLINLLIILRLALFYFSIKFTHRRYIEMYKYPWIEIVHKLRKISDYFLFVRKDKDERFPRLLYEIRLKHRLTLKNLDIRT